MKNLLRVVALFVVVVLVASGCSYSEEAEPGVRNFSLETKTERVMVHLSDDCERDAWGRPASFGCFTVSEQQRAASLLNAVNYLIRYDDEIYFDAHGGKRTQLLKLLIDFEALEVLCYTSVYHWMEERELWPLGTHFGPFGITVDHHLLTALNVIAITIDTALSKVVARPFIDPLDGETPVLEPVRYRHLCPSWIMEP